MGRIGNLLSTWQREVRVRDFTSGVFARAVQQGDLELDDLERRAGRGAFERSNRARRPRRILHRALAAASAGDPGDRPADPQRRPADRCWPV